MNKLPSDPKIDKPSSYDLSRLNATTHGITSKQRVLQSEDPEEYSQLLAEYKEEFNPIGRTQTHCVEQLTDVDWRLRRIRSAELSMLQTRGDNVRNEIYNENIRFRIEELLSTSLDPGLRPSQTPAINAWDIDSILHRCNTVLNKLKNNGDDAYEEVVNLLHSPARALWSDVLSLNGVSGPHNYADNAEGLISFLSECFQPWLEGEKSMIEDEVKKAQQRYQLDFDVCERLARYETHLDRKYERLLSMLLKLQERRKTIDL